MQDTITYLAHLTDRSVLEVSGSDAQDFLNGLVTADIATLADGGCVHAGLLTPQGKILFEFLVHRDGDVFRIDVAETAHADLAKRLGFYKLRAAVEIAIVPAAGIYAAWGAAPGGSPDPRLPVMGTRFVEPNAAEAVFTAHYVPASLTDYEARRVSFGVPEGGKDYSLGDAFPHDACFDQLGGVSFTKGCYVGQEVVSRMRHRGTARRRVVLISADGALPERGTDILAGERSIGTLGSCVEGGGLAIARIDRVTKAIAGDVAFTCGGVSVNIRVPDWADYSLDIEAEAS